MVMVINKKKTHALTAAERRFAKEMAVLAKMPLHELLTVERTRMTVGI